MELCCLATFWFLDEMLMVFDERGVACFLFLETIDILFSLATYFEFFVVWLPNLDDTL